MNINADEMKSKATPVSTEIDADEMKSKAGEASALLSALANEKRMLILCQLVNQERSVGELAESLGARPSTISQHLALLRRDGIVEQRRDAQSHFYSLVDDEARAVLETLYSLYCGDSR
jgi:DNA-binding transcriptional ArsR family regulator